MGDIDKFVTVIQASKETQKQKINDLEDVIETLKATVADMNENLEELKQQNEVLKVDLKDKVQETNDKTLMDKEELHSLESEILNLRTALEKSENNYTSLQDKLKLSEEAVEDKSNQISKLKGEIKEMAQEETQFNLAQDKLKVAYNTLMKKYISLKKSSREEIERLTNINYEQSEGQLDADSKSSAQKSESKTENSNSNVIGEDTDEDVTKNQLEEQLEKLKQDMEAEKRIMEDHFDRFKQEVSEKSKKLEERDEEISSLNAAIKDLNQKRYNLLEKLNSQSQGGSKDLHQSHERSHSTLSQVQSSNHSQIAYNINPGKLLKFLNECETKLKTLYKDFINYSILKEEDKMQYIQLGINTLVEELNDFRDYCQIKLKYLKDKGFKMEGLE